MSSMSAETAVRLPSPALRSFITKYAGFRISGLPPGVHFGLPSSEVHLFISLGRPIELLQTPNTTQSPSALTAFVSGLQDRPAIVRQNAQAFGLHVFIKPLGVKAILGVASSEISGLVLSLNDVWGRRAEDLIGRLLDASTWRERFAIMDRAFASKLNPAIARPEIRWSWERLAKRRGSVPVQQLADEVCYSRRHFSQQFRKEIGVSPKLAARLFRFERACHLIGEKRLGLAQVALSCGYYDQAHLTREWYALAGCSPKAWVTREFPFLQDYELERSENEFDDFKQDHSLYAIRR
jgi:AraC-like DNA-binding protein